MTTSGLSIIYFIGVACKLKFRRKLKPLGSVSAALKYFELPPPGFQHQSTQTEKPSCCDCGMNTDAEITESLPLLQKHFETLPECEQVQVLESLLSTVCTTQGVVPTPIGYIKNSLSAMHHLKSKHKSIVLASAAYVFGKMRPDHTDSRFPTDRMPFGLLEHCINFYSAQSISEYHAL